MTKQEQLKGFTLLELLIVIAILSILAMALILVLNPAETLKKSRDSQRMADLSTIKTAIGLYLTNVTSPDLSTDATDNARCVNGSGTASVFYSAAITDTDVAGSTGNVADANAGKGDIDGANGWLPINLTSISSGAPISNYPLDPVNSAVNGTSTAAAVTNSALVYRYQCDATGLTYEVDATLESSELSAKMGTDGGDNANLYETGTKLTILPGTDNF